MVPAGAASIPFVLLGTAATVIASQALISGVFSLVYQAIRLGYFPQGHGPAHLARVDGPDLRAVHERVPGGELDRAGAAVPRIGPARRRLRPRGERDDGRDVAGVLSGRAHSFRLVVRRSPRSSWPAFLVVDLAFFGANLLKFVDGGYVPAIVGAVFLVIMMVWARGRSLLRVHYAAQSEPTAAFLDKPAAPNRQPAARRRRRHDGDRRVDPSGAPERRPPLQGAASDGAADDGHDRGDRRM